MCYLLPIWDPDVLPATYLGLQCVTCYLFRTSVCYLLPIRVPGGLPPTYFLLLLVECDDEIKIAAVCLLLLSLCFLPEVSCPLSSAAAAGGRRVISSAARQVTVTTLGGDWLYVTVLHCR